VRFTCRDHVIIGRLLLEHPASGYYSRRSTDRVPASRHMRLASRVPRSRMRSDISTSAGNPAAGSSSSRASSSCSRHGDRSGDVRSMAVARRAHGRRRRADFGVEASMLKLRASDLRCASRPMRCSSTAATATARLSRRTFDARRENHPDLGRHQSNPSPVHRAQFHEEVATEDTELEPSCSAFTLCPLRQTVFELKE